MFYYYIRRIITIYKYILPASILYPAENLSCRVYEAGKAGIRGPYNINPVLNRAEYGSLRMLIRGRTFLKPRVICNVNQKCRALFDKLPYKLREYVLKADEDAKAS